MQPVSVAALGAHPHALVLQLQVLDIDRQRLAGPGGRLIQQPPQRLLPHANVLTAPQPLQLGEGMALVR